MAKATSAEVDLIRGHFRELFEPIGDDWEREKPILAHYTSVEVAEKIIAAETLWFSNPLYMNDHEELRWGIAEVARLVREDPGDQLLAAAGSEQRREQIQFAFDHYVKHYEQEFVLKIFASCWTQHRIDEQDGILSMWRGYGGNGRGAAIEINTSQIQSIDTSPLLLLKVSYGDDNSRRKQIGGIFDAWCTIIATKDIADHLLYLSAYEFFQLSLLYALSIKHIGFSEENEWRLVYLPDRDTSNALEPFIKYAVVRGRTEPKLILKVQPIAGVIHSSFSWDKIVHGALLGPGQNDPLSIAGFRFMLERLKKGNLLNLLKVSGIPFRA